MAGADLWKLWTAALQEADRAIQVLIDLQQDFQGKYDEMSDKKQESDKGVNTLAIAEADLQGAQDLVQEAMQLEKP